MSDVKKINKIAIIGLGLIGGSLARALKKKQYEIVGISKSLNTVRQAKDDGVIDEAYTEINASNLKSVDLIFLTGPLDIIPQHIKQIAECVTHPIILTDAGSTKEEICEVAKNILPRHITFVGGHPMAGTEKAGYSASVEDLFKQCAWILTSIDDSYGDKGAIKLLGKVIIDVGGKPIFTTPEKHDKAVALVSHVPLLASIGLCQIVKNLKDIELQKLASIIASSGYKDMTRIGGGNPDMNANLLMANLSEILYALPYYKEELDKITGHVIDEPERLLKVLKDVHIWRSKLYGQDGKNSLLNAESLSS